jgi:hypothetical protein
MTRQVGKVPVRQTARDPYLSIVVTSRNDDHGGGLLRRMGCFVRGLLDLAKMYKLRGELVVVEWNPPPGPRLAEVLRPPRMPGWFEVRFVEVPGSIHRRWPRADAIPLFQMIAKNVGIRRARGRFVLATNPDLLFSEELVRFLADERLREDALYRVDRYDVAADVPEDVGVAEQLRWCADHVIRVHRRLGSVAVLPRGRWVRALVALAMRPRKGWVVPRPRFWAYRAAHGLARMLDPLSAVHTNGCGDFTLLARDRWFQLRGYPEVPLWSMHLDAFLCYAAVASGVNQVVLGEPMRIYHIEHGRSWATTGAHELLGLFVERPWLDLWVLQGIAREMLRNRRPLIVNPPEWGLAGLELQETSWGGGDFEGAAAAREGGQNVRGTAGAR